MAEVLERRLNACSSCNGVAVRTTDNPSKFVCASCDEAIPDPF